MEKMKCLQYFHNIFIENLSSAFIITMYNYFYVVEDDYEGYFKESHHAV